MSDAARQWVSPEEYLDLEERAEYKNEYFDGEIYAMAGATPEHNLVAANVARELGNQLEDRPCLVFSSDQRVRVRESGLYTYPDVTVVCAEPTYDDRDNLLNPTVLVEVLSESTEAYDRGLKFDHYKTLSSLRECVLVASDRRQIERFSRSEGDNWVLTACSDLNGSVVLPSIGCTLELDRVYRKVEFREPEPGRRRGPRRT